MGLLFGHVLVAELVKSLASEASHVQRCTLTGMKLMALLGNRHSGLTFNMMPGIMCIFYLLLYGIIKLDCSSQWHGRKPLKYLILRMCQAYSVSFR